MNHPMSNFEFFVMVAIILFFAWLALQLGPMIRGDILNLLREARR